MKKKLAILGASIAQKPLYLKAKEMGLEIYSFAWDKGEDAICKEFADHYYPISYLEKELILEKCQEIGIDGITTMANDNCIPTVCYVSEKMGLTSNRYEDALISINKLGQRKAFMKHGVNSPRFVFAEENADYSGLTYPLMVKATDRAGSTGIIKVEKGDNLKEAIEYAKKLSFSGNAIVEEFVTGKEFCAECICWDREVFVLVVTETETLGGPLYSKIAYHQPANLDANQYEIVKKEAQKALNSLNFICGCCDIEMIITKEGEAKIIEVNPRMCGDATEAMIRLSTGFDYLKAGINVAFGKFEKPVHTLNKCSGIYFLSKETEYLKPIIENAKNDPEIIIAEINDGELRNLQGIEGRSGFLIYQSDKRKIWKK
jgi:biotin carboxylase